MKTTVTLFTLLFSLCVQAHAQEIRWQEDARLTYVYEISNDEAEKFVKIYPKDSLLIKKMLHTPHSSFSDQWKERPEKGHFIFVEIDKGKVNYRYVSIIPFQVFLFREYGALTLQVIDANEQIRSDANVFIRYQGFLRQRSIYVPFNENSRTYTIYEYSEEKKRLMVVELDSFRAIFDLSKHFVSPSYGRYNSYNQRPSFYSYLITDKNKYKPGETVRFKSYALAGDRMPLTSNLEIWMQTDNTKRYSYKKIDMVSPYHSGGYAGEINLHDSLQLKLDKQYTFQLRDKNGKIVASTSFQYEDYELYDSRLETKMDNVHYAPFANSLEIKALDANGLFLQDVQAEIIVKRGNVMKSFTDVLQLPDTLMYKRIDLENDKPTLAEIPANLFGKSNCNYTVEIKALTHDNQALSSMQHAVFYQSAYEVVTTTRNDTICFQWKELGKDKNRQAEFWINNDSNERKIVELPYEIPFNQSVREYNFTVDSLHYAQFVAVSTLDPQLDIEGGISADSFHVKLVNPLKLELSWCIYQGNRLLGRGSGTDFDLYYPKTNLYQTHYVEFFYIMGGVEQSYHQTFVPKTDLLDIAIDLPDRIYPGQTIDATVSVKNYWGNPVEDVDLTAFAYNSQLDYSVPDLPYHGTIPQTREQRPSYSIQDKNYALSVQLDYPYWNQKLQLDTMKYYQFTYPHNKLFLHTVNTPDSTTQIAPYIMKNGEAVAIYVIEINQQPVYFSWTEQPKRYSFLISDTGKQHILFRLHDRIIILDSISFETGKKTIFSMDMDSLPTHAVTVMLHAMKDRYGNALFRDKDSNYLFSDTEKKTYQSLISQIQVNFPQDFIYLKQGETIHPIFHSCFRSQRLPVLAGPLPQGYMNYCDGIRYRHENGFSYEFEDNVVYKSPLEGCPKILRFSSSNQITTLNDFALTTKVFNQLVENCQKIASWYPQEIQIARNNMNLNLKLKIPLHPDSVGLSYLLLQDVNTKRILFLDRQWQEQMKIYYIFPTVYDIILLYDNGDYRCFDNINLKSYTYTEVNMSYLPLQERDSISMKWFEIKSILKSFQIYSPPQMDTPAERPAYGVATVMGYSPAQGATIKGCVTEMDGKTPLEWANVCLMQEGKIIIRVITDERGKYSFTSVPAGIYDIRVTYMGFSDYLVESIAVRGTKIVDDIKMQGIPLEAVFIMARKPMFERDDAIKSKYVDDKELKNMSSRTVEGALATMSGVTVGANRGNSIYYVDGIPTLSAPMGGRGLGNMETQIPREELEDSVRQVEIQAAEERLYNEIMQLNSLRSNFSDVGFWEPRLYTDQQGEAKFSVTFPDNITQWNTIVYAMNRKLQTATLRTTIQSYKPLMAELKTPQFLVAGDTAYYAGNMRNYTRDSEITGQMLFIVGEDTTMNQSICFTSSHQDKMQVTPLITDSLTTTYIFQRNDGYTDGEKRTIPVIPRGTEIVDGTLQFLKSGNQKTIAADTNEEIYITITANPLDVYLDETYFLRDYRYDCNEQLASKLIGLLNDKLYQEYAGKKTLWNDKRIDGIINKLVKNRNENKLWSWWGNASNTNFWMSAHIIRALNLARKAGYKVNLDLTDIAQDYIHTTRYRDVSLQDIEILNALSDAETQQNYAPAIEFFDKEIAHREYIADSIARVNRTKNTTSYLKEKLLLLEIRQRQHIGYSADSIQKYLKTDVLGAVYCDDSIERKWYDNALITTLIAYRIISQDSSLQHLKEAMQLYILRTKSSRWNTYQASSAVMTIFPDLLADKATKKTPSTVFLSGKAQGKIDTFPYTTTLYPGEQLHIEMKSGIPIIYSAHQLKRTTTQHIGDAFNIQTRLSNDSLIAGRKDTLHVTLQVKQANAEHVLIEIPIPAGYSYASKPANFYPYYMPRQETYREYFKDRVVIFCESLPIGTYNYHIELLSRYSGNYYLSPAKVEMMYFPVVYSNNDERKVSIYNKQYE